MNNYFDLIQDLFKNPDFIVLTTKNMPSIIVSYKNMFYTESFEKALESQFESLYQRLKVITASNPHFL